MPASEFLDTLAHGGTSYTIASLPKVSKRWPIAHLPFSLKILLESLVRNHDGRNITDRHLEALATWDPAKRSDQEIDFMPARVVLQDFTGVPCVVDLAAMRDAVVALGGKPESINPQIPSELVIDHSIQVDSFGRTDAMDINSRLEFKRNFERYALLRWGQQAFDNFKVVPPNTGIVHQVNLEKLARVVESREIDGTPWLFPDSVFGTDSHTTMINALGVLGWGVGGIEAEAAMLGEPSSMLIPEVVGFELTGRLSEGVTATDLVLTVTEMLRKHGVVGKFVEFFGAGLSHLPLADRATISNMSPEYGATCGMFPIDQETLNYLRLSGRNESHIELVEAYARAQGLWHDENTAPASYSQTLTLDLGDVRASMAGPRRPQDRVLLEDVPQNFSDALPSLAGDRQAIGPEVGKYKAEGGAQEQAERLAHRPVAHIELESGKCELHDGSVVIAAITSCTNTSNPAVMLAAGLLARNARAKGLSTKPWVKTSMGPGSKVVTDYLNKADLMGDLEGLGFHVVGYGCTTCIGNSGPLPQAVSKGIEEQDLVVASVLSGNRNFEGRIHAEVKANYLASPPLVVAYALAGSVNINLRTDPLGHTPDGEPVFLRDIWPSNKDIGDLIADTVSSEMFERNYQDVFEGDAQWKSLPVPDGQSYAWDEKSTYIKQPPYFKGLKPEAGEMADIEGARLLGVFGDSITTDHISPAGAIQPDSPAGRFLQSRGVRPADFNSYGSRRGSDDVMVRGTFANIRLRNALAQGKEGGYTTYVAPDGGSSELMSIYDAAMRYKADGVPLVVMAGEEYGTGSSRDWAAKGTLLLGVKAVIARSFERIHRANLVGMGVLPCLFKGDTTPESLGLDGTETIRITGLRAEVGGSALVEATRADGEVHKFEVDVLLQTPKEVEYYLNGGLLPYVVRKLSAS